MGVARRFGEPAAPGRGVRRSVQPAAPASPAAQLLWLQASAGNQAVTGLLGVQRDPDPTPEPTVAEQIAEARELVTRGEIDAPAFEHYRTSKAGTVAEVVGLLWLNDLALVEVDPAGAGIAKRADKKLVSDFKALLQARVGKALTAKFRDLTKQVGTSGTKIGDQVEAILKESPAWAEGTVADRLFVEWVGPAPVGNRSPAGAQDLWGALRRAGASSVASNRADHLSKTAVKALDATEVNAVRTLLDPSPTWIVTPEETADLTDKVAAALGRPPTARARRGRSCGSG
jgi:hypothetical protein